MALAPGTVTILMHHTLESGQPVVEMRVPTQYIRGPVDRVVDNLGISFFATYPDLKGGNAPENAGLATCIGLCRGLMIIYVENRAGDDWNLTHKLSTIELIYGNKNLKLLDGMGLFPYAATAFNIRYKPTRVIKYFYGHINSKHDNVIVECEPSDPRPTCREWTRSLRHPSLWIEYTFSYRYIEEWPRIHHDIVNLVDSLYVTQLVANPHKPPIGD